MAVVGCHSSNNDAGGSGGPIIADNQLRDLASQTADSEPTALGDAATLRSDINALFNGADTDPIEVETGDSVQDVLNRAGGS